MRYDNITVQRILSLIPDRHGAQKEFAQLVGVRESAIADWKAGRIKSYNNYIYKIAYLYDVSAEWLLGNTDNPTPLHIQTALSDDEKQMLYLFRHLSDSDQKRAVTILEGLCN